MRDRGSVVLIENNKVALIKRNHEGSVYCVFPGGGIEEGETPETGTKREALEELGVKVQVNECMAKVEHKGGTQYFFLAVILEGTFGTGQGEEYTDRTRGRGTYLPMWVDIDELTSIDVKPKEVGLKVQTLFS